MILKQMKNRSPVKTVLTSFSANLSRKCFGLLIAFVWLSEANAFEYRDNNPEEVSIGINFACDDVPVSSQKVFINNHAVVINKGHQEVNCKNVLSVKLKGFGVIYESKPGDFKELRTIADRAQRRLDIAKMNRLNVTLEVRDSYISMDDTPVLKIIFDMPDTCRGTGIGWVDKSGKSCSTPEN